MPGTGSFRSALPDGRIDGERSRARVGPIGSRLKRILLPVTLASVGLPAVARAQEPVAGLLQALTEGTPLANSFEVINFALVIGAVSAAMISAIWLIRERGKIATENSELRSALSQAQTEVARLDSLVVENDRAYVIWDGQSAADIRGSLPALIGAPRRGTDFLAFGIWLDAISAARIERAIDSLRYDANGFDIVLESQRGHLIEAHGRTSGGKAFVRFAPLTNLRAELAGLKAERDRLVSAMEALQTLLDTIDMPVWLRDKDDRLAWVNQAYVIAVEASDCADAVDREQELLTTQSRQKILAERSIDRPFVDLVSTVVRGNRFFFEVTDAIGAEGSAGIACDVTDAEAMREELKRTVESHAETLDHLATPVAIFDAERRLQFYNQAFQALWELDTPYLDGNPEHGEFLERLRADGKLPEPPSWHEWKDEVLSVYHAVDPQPHLWHLPDGQTLNVFANIHPRGGVTWVFENLTEKYDLETRYNTLVKVQGETIDYLAEGVCVFGADGRLKLSNPAFRALWAVPEKTAVPGVHIHRIAEICKPSYDGPDGWDHFASIITDYDEERRTYEGRLELRSGLVLDYALVPLPNAQMMLTFVNVTDSARVEKALTDKNEALQKADALKNDFVKHVSYELRSPLTNIIGFTDLLKTPEVGPLNEKQSDYVDHISSSSALLLTVVNDILDLTTVDAGIMQLDMASLDIHELVDDAAALIADRMKENGVSLAIELASDIGTMVADQQRLKQILFKLLNNAANYAPEGSVVTLACRRDGGDVVFSVSDSGPGIPQDVLETVFNRFETHNTAGRRTSGAGLGLSIVDSFVSLHNGTVEVVSGKDQGTTVVCRLPAEPTAPSQAAE